MNEYEGRYEQIKLEVLGSIAIIQFNRSDAMNAANNQMIKEYYQALDTCNADSKIRAVITTGNRHTYCSGKILFRRSKPVGASVGKSIDAYSIPGFYTKPKIAMISGYCVDAGLQQALTCELRIASSNARFIIPQNRAGFYKHILLPKTGKELRPDPGIAFYKEKTIDAWEALKHGIVNMVVEPKALRETTLALARILSSAVDNAS